MKALRFPLSNILKISLLIISLIFLLIYFLLVSNRITYPYELEWMEGGSVDHVSRLLSGQRLYIEPSLEFTPFMYTPLYYYISAFFTKLFGLGFFPLRLVSFLSSLGCFIILYEFVRRETKSIILGIFSAGLFAATFRISGAWFDIARVDSLFLLFLLWGVFLIRFHDSPKNQFFAGLLISLSFLTKQTALLIAIGISFYCLLCLPKQSKFIFPATFLLAIGLSTLVINWMSGGWYYYYIFNLPRQHSIVMAMVGDFWRNDIKHVSLAFALSLVYILFLFLTKKWKDFVFYIIFFLSMLAASWFSRLHSGGYNNVLFPAYAVISIFFALGIHVLIRKVTAASTKENNNTFLRVKTLNEYFVFFICILQFLFLIYNPFNQVPNKEDVDAGHAFIEMLSSIDGEVYVPFHGFYTSLAGKKTYAQGMAVKDVLRSKNDEIKWKLKMQIVEAIRSKKFAAIILDTDSGELGQEIKKEYIPRGKIFKKADVFWPVTGVKTRPTIIYK